MYKVAEPDDIGSDIFPQLYVSFFERKNLI